MRNIHTGDEPCSSNLQGLRRELARAGEHRLDVGGGSLLAANLGLVDCVVDGQDGLVFRLERAQVEAASAEVL